MFRPWSWSHVHLMSWFSFCNLKITLTFFSGTVTPGNYHLQVAVVVVVVVVFKWKRLEISNKIHNSLVNTVDFRAVSKAHSLQRFGEYKGCLNIHCVISFKSAVPCKVEKEKLDFLIDAVLNQIIMVDLIFLQSHALITLFLTVKH